MRIFKYIALLLLFSGCNQTETKTEISGNWLINLNVQQKTLPFLMEISSDQTSAIIHNSSEMIHLDLEKKGEKWLLPFKSYDTAMEFTTNDNKLVGTWTKFNKKKPYVLPFIGSKTKLNSFVNVEAFNKLPKKWKITFIGKEKNKDAILLFSKSKDQMIASVITSTGDYRFLRPVLKNNKLYLYGFDGVFSFVFDGELSNNNTSFKGKMFAGRSWNQEFSAVPDPSFELKDPNSITTSTQSNLELTLTNLEGKKVNINDPKYSDKPKVIQIFGSWCPNCIDETNYVLKWKKNRKLDAYFFIVSFERSPSKKHALKMLKKFQKAYGVDYPILIGGYTREDKVKDVFPTIKGFASFPTMIILDKAGKVRKIHSGFNGPATGMYYEKFDMDFTKTIEKLN